MIQVESGGNPTAVNKEEDAVGILQIRPCVIADVNTIFGTSYTSEDRLEIKESLEICTLYLTYWSSAYSARTAKAPTQEVLARIWNGSPLGYKKSPLLYWEKVEYYLSKVDTLHLCNICGIITPHQVCLKCDHIYLEQDSSLD